MPATTTGAVWAIADRYSPTRASRRSRATRSVRKPMRSISSLSIVIAVRNSFLAAFSPRRLT